MCSCKKLSKHGYNVPACVTMEPLGPVRGAVSMELTAVPCGEKPLPLLSQHSPTGKALQLEKEQAGLSPEGRRRGNNEGNSLGEARQKRPFDLTNG